MPPELRFGIIGLGAASTQILPFMVKHPGIKVAGACSTRPHAREQFTREFDAEAYGSAEELCSSPNVDAVYVCTPNHLHRGHAVTALEHKKHVIVEKPMACTIEDCELMNAAAAKNGVQLMAGHTHSFDLPVQKMREIVRNGELGPLRQIITFTFNDFMYRPRMPQELDPALGGNVVFNQGPHQTDIVRLIGGGMVRSVRAMTGIWDQTRRAEGAWAMYLEFEDGTPALMSFNGYAHFDSAELGSWVGESGDVRDPEANAKSRRRLKGLSQQEEMALKGARQYAAPGQTESIGSALPAPKPHQPFYGFTLLSCEGGDIRQSADSLYVYDDDGRREVPLQQGYMEREAELDEMYRAVTEGRSVAHDGRWGEATLEVVLGMMTSAQERREVFMSHQVPSPK